MAVFGKGVFIKAEDGTDIEILEFLAEGAQGEIYRACNCGRETALKWYKLPAPSEEFRLNLVCNIDKGIPDERFLWPRKLTARVGGSFGYLMDICPEGYFGLGKFLLDKNINFRSWKVMLEAAMNVAGAFATLHSIGCSYQDVNEGSFFINPIDGDIRICDCDNVAPFGVGGLDIKGTGFFMAPEVILGISMPDAESDRFSLAVILFRMFYLDHPLEGTATLGYALTDGISARLFGRNPVFVYDPEDDSNRPHPKVHVNVIVRWKMFPPELREAFTRVFTDGLKNRGARLTGAQWIDVLVRVRGQLLAADGQEGFVNAHRAASSLDDYFVLRFQEYVVALGQNSCLYRYQTDNSSLDYKTVVGMVYSTASGSLELCNVSTDNWVAYHDGGTGIMICPGMALDLMPGLRIDFSGVIGQVD